MFGSKKRLAEEIAAAEEQARESELHPYLGYGLEKARRMQDRARGRGDKASQAHWAILVLRYLEALDAQARVVEAKKTGEDAEDGTFAALRKAANDSAFREADSVHLQADAAKSIRTIEKVLKHVDPQRNPSNYAYFVRLRERYEEKLVMQQRASMGVERHTPVDEAETAAEISEEASPGGTPEAEVRRLRRALAARDASLALASKRVGEARAEVRDLKAKVYSYRIAASTAGEAQRKAEQERTRSAAKAYKKGYARGKKHGVAIGERQGAVVEKVRNLISQKRTIHVPPTSATVQQWVDRQSESGPIRFNKATVSLPEPTKEFQAWLDSAGRRLGLGQQDTPEPQNPETD